MPTTAVTGMSAMLSGRRGGESVRVRLRPVEVWTWALAAGLVMAVVIAWALAWALAWAVRWLATGR